MSDTVTRTPEASVPAPLPDDENPALIDAKQAFIVTIVGAALFIGVVLVFVLF